MSHNQGPISVVLATDSFLIGDGLASLLADVADTEVVGRARDLDELLELVERLTPEAVIVSIRTPVVTTMPTILAARHLRDQFPKMGIVIISDRGSGFALELLRGGASRIAYLLDERLPNMAAVLAALQEVRAGQTVLDPGIVDSLVQRRDELAIDDLNPRETEFLEQLAHGLSNRAIAAKLHVSTKSVEKYVSTIFRKLGLDDQDADRRVTAALAFLQAQTEPFGIQVAGGEGRRGDSPPATSQRRCGPCPPERDRTGGAAASRRAIGAGTARAAAPRGRGRTVGSCRCDRVGQCCMDRLRRSQRRRSGIDGSRPVVSGGLCCRPRRSQHRSGCRRYPGGSGGRPPRTHEGARPLPQRGHVTLVRRLHLLPPR